MYLMSVSCLVRTETPSTYQTTKQKSPVLLTPAFTGRTKIIATGITRHDKCDKIFKVE